MDLSEVHDCDKCHGKIVAVEVDELGIERCAYCHEIVDYSAYFREEFPLSLCEGCWCVTHTLRGACAKCGFIKEKKGQEGLSMEGIHCDNCPNGRGKTEKEMARTSCDGLFNKCNCFIGFLHDKKLIYIPNGSTGLAVTEALYNALRHYSTKKGERKGEDLCIPKPCDFANAYVSKLKKGCEEESG